MKRGVVGVEEGVTRVRRDVTWVGCGGGVLL